VIVVLVLICCAMSGWAQWPQVNEKLNTVYDLKSKYPHAVFKVNGALIDDNALKSTLDAIMPKDIFDVTIVQAEKGLEPGLIASREFVAITTKASAKAAYQKTLSAYSLDYRNYLDANRNDDGNLQYILNAQLLKNGSNEQLDMLYKLSPEKITNVAFTEINGKKAVIIDIKFDE
jgi:hypothetical protein